MSNAATHTPVITRRAGRRPARASVLRAALAVVLAGSLVAPAAGQGARVEVHAAIGWNNEVFPDRWCPIRVMICGPGGVPLERAVGGTIVVRAPQDATQQAELRLEVAGTPGRVTRVDGVVCLPRFVDRIDVEFVDATGAVRASEVRVRYPDDERGELPLPTVAATGCLVAATDGTQTLSDDLLKQWRRRGDVFDPAMRVRSVRIDAAEFPVTPAAYRSIDLLVLDAGTMLDGRAASAIREWVLGGGRLVVMASRAGEGWAHWVAGERGAMPIEVGEPRAGPLPASIATAAQAPILDVRVGDDRRQRRGEPEAKPQPPAGPVSIAASSPQRWLRVSVRGKAEGWRVRWPVDESAGAAGAGLLAEGPVGLGRVVVLGIDPRRAVVKGDDDERSVDRLAEGLWREALDRLLADEVPASGVFEDEYDYRVSSGGSVREAIAVRGVLDQIVTVEPLDGRVFAVIGGAMLVLAALVGPGDYFLLRTRVRRHRSWMTALGWIAAASAASYWGPGLLRDSRTRLSRVSVIDAVPGAEAGAPALAYQTSLTSVWAGATRRVRVGAGRPEDDSGGWWRGVSGVERSWQHEGGRLMPVTEFRQRPPAVETTVDVWGGLSVGRGGSTEPVTEGIALRGWTLRTFMDESRVACPVFATVIDTPGSGAIVRLGGVPTGARVAGAAARTKDGWMNLEFREGSAANGQSLRRQFEAALPTRATPIPPVGGRSADPAVGTLRPAWESWMDGSVLELPGAARRRAALEDRVASGAWMVLHLHLEGMPMDVPVEEGVSALRQVVVRLAVPMERMP